MLDPFLSFVKLYWASEFTVFFLYSGVLHFSPLSIYSEDFDFELINIEFRYTGRFLRLNYDTLCPLILFTSQREGDI